MTEPGARARIGILPGPLALVALAVAGTAAVTEGTFRSLWSLGLPPLAYALCLGALVAGAALLPWRRTGTAGAALALAGSLPLALATLREGGAGWSAAMGLLAAGAALVLRHRRVLAERRWLARAALGLVRRRWRTVLAVAAAIATLAVGWRRLRPLPPAPAASRAARAYLDEAITLVRRQSMWRDTVSWDAVTDSAFARLGAARRPADTHRAVRYVLRSLGDHHSVLIPWTDQPLRLETHGDVAPDLRAARLMRLPEGRFVAPGVAYLAVPWFADGYNDRAAWTARLDALRDSLDAAGACGWVVDLRPNLGGNMWPMLDGLAPLLRDGPVGGITMPQWGREVHWWVVSGRTSPFGPVPSALAGLVRGRRTLRSADAPVAILLGPLTVSSGEAVAIAFRARPRTRFFGQPSGGLSTANGLVRLSDGSRIAVTIGVDMDGAGVRYGGPIVPDDVIAPDSLGDGDAALAAAADWLRGGEPCRRLAVARREAP